ncbi:MAG: alpha/beta hydrolase family protein [Actinomycetota bacterium]
MRVSPALTRRAPAFAAVLVLVVAAACSSGSSDAGPGTGDSGSATTLPAAEAAQAYTDPGPYPVGITTLALDSGQKVEVWYPAVKGTTGTDTYDVRAQIPETVRNLLTANIPATFSVDAGRDAAVADGRFPLVLFSHGFSGFRQQSSFLTAHLASWGFVVAAPDHWQRDLFHVLDRVLGGSSDTPPDPVEDLRQTRTLMESQDTTAGSRFAGLVRSDQVVAVGHSAGGGTVLGVADDEGVVGYVSMASGLLRSMASTTTTSVAPPELPDTPSLFLAGSTDVVVPVAEATEPAFAAASPPTRLWVIDKVGHNGFDDLCTLGGGKGIIGIAEASGLGSFLDAQPSFRRLGQDGCLAPAVPVRQTFPIIEHAVTAFVRNAFGIDAEPVGLGPDVAGEYSVPVTIRERLS